MGFVNNASLTQARTRLSLYKRLLSGKVAKKDAATFEAEIVPRLRLSREPKKEAITALVKHLKNDALTDEDRGYLQTLIRGTQASMRQYRQREERDRRSNRKY